MKVGEYVMADYTDAFNSLIEFSEVLETDIVEIENEVEKIRNYINNYDDEEKAIVDELIEKKAIEVDIAIPQIIQKWYDSYSPIFYDRREDLKNAYESTSVITPEEASITISWGIDSGKMPNGSNGLSSMMMDYLAFKQGYHGGANPKGVYYAAPRYRKPHPYYTYWGRPAVKTAPIDQEIEAFLKIYNQQLQAEYDLRVGMLKNKYGIE